MKLTSLPRLIALTAALTGLAAPGAARPQATLDLNGTWNLQVQVVSASGICAGEIGSVSSYAATITQVGNAVTVAAPGLGISLVGTLTGNVLNVSGSYPEDGGTTTILSSSITASNCSLSGTDTWSWTDGVFSCNGVDHVTGARAAECADLSVAPSSISLASGGTAVFALDSGGSWPGSVYLLAGSASGTTPGFPVNGVTVPLNVDAYSLLTLEGSLIQNAFGLLDASGLATATLTAPPGTNANLVGLTLHHAYVVIDVAGIPRVQFASNPVAVTLVP